MPNLRVDEVLERLQTKGGQQVVAEIVNRLKPVLPQGQYEGGLAGGPTLPRIDDKFDRNLAESVVDMWIRAGDMPRELPGAIAQLLVPLADAKGNIDPQHVQRTLGPQGLRFLQTLANLDDTSPADQLADRRSLDPVAGQLGKQALANAPFIAPKMAALDFMVDSVAQPDELKGMQFMGLQHLFASSTTLFDALHKTGIEYGDMRFVGKIYSTNFRAASDLERRGATVDEVSRRIKTGDFGKQMGKSIESQLGHLVNNLREQLRSEGVYSVAQPPDGHVPRPMALLIDDGAEAIKLLHEKFPEYAPYFFCVEQTRRGARILHEMEAAGQLKCPVANVAETWAKLEHESPMIGHSVVLEVGKKLDRLLRADIPVSKEALVIGCGAVGGQVARAMLDRRQDVHLWDKDPARAQKLADELKRESPDATVVVHTDKHEALQHGGVLISCVGMRTIFPEDHAFLPDGAVLVNAASSDDELGPQELLPFAKHGSVIDDQSNVWQTFHGHPLNVGMGAATAHSDEVVKLKDGRELLVVSHGFVVNMTGERDPIPPRYIQLTRSLLFLGALAAKRAGKAGVVDVPRDQQEALVNLVNRELKKSGENLDRPSWDKKERQLEQPLGDPPPDIVEQAHQESIERAAARGAIEDIGPVLSARQLASTEIAGNIDKPDRPLRPEDRPYGLKLGPVERGSREAVIADLVEGKRELTVEAAALYRATADVNRVFAAHFVASLKGDSRVFVEQSRVEHTPGKTVQGDGATDPKARFEELFGHMSRILVGSMLGRMLKRPPTEAEVGARLKQLFSQSKVDTTRYKAMLGRGDDADRELLKALG